MGPAVPRHPSRPGPARGACPARSPRRVARPSSQATSILLHNYISELFRIFESTPTAPPLIPYPGQAARRGCWRNWLRNGLDSARGRQTHLDERGPFAGTVQPRSPRDALRLRFSASGLVKKLTCGWAVGDLADPLQPQRPPTSTSQPLCAPVPNNTHLLKQAGRVVLRVVWRRS